MRTRRSQAHAFTIIELLVVVSIIALLIGILLPAIGKARDQARTSISQANLRNLGTAHSSYAAEWNDRQLTFIDDNMSTYGGGLSDAFEEYWATYGGGEESTQHPPLALGWGRLTEAGGYMWFAYRTGANCANGALTVPIEFTGAGCNPGLAYFGSFRMPNAEQFNRYVGGRFYDQVFYAPKDTVVIDAIGPCQDSPDSFCNFAEVPDTLGDIPVWSSYVLSPAAMFNPAVMRHVDDDDDSANGFVSPWDMPAGFRSPSMSLARYANLKTHMLEHHWLQGTRADCNPSFDPGTYGSEGCEPYYFNHAWESSPATLFYDGHVENIGVRKAMRADGRMREQTGDDRWGLWSRDTPFGEDGYYSDLGYDQALSSFHILTTDGIRGRDVLSD
jgi:prepilin-type N-terminal cleavage/methylation domain-containing protein